MRTDAPWQNLQVPTASHLYTSRKMCAAAPEGAPDLYWAKNSKGECCLLIEGVQAPSTVPWPPLENIRIQSWDPEQLLALELRDGSLLPTFDRLCDDVRETVEHSTSAGASKAIRYCLERWSSLMRAGRLKLGKEAQKGLIGELLFLETAAESRGFDAALSAWQGPLKDKQDFAFGQALVEVKTKRGSAYPSVLISSESQLNSHPGERLYLCVYEINATVGDDGFTINDVVGRLKNGCETPGQRDELRAKLAQAGYLEEDADQYESTRWTEGWNYCYEVRDGFPRVESKDCPEGVSHLSYELDLDCCEDYAVEGANLLEAIS